MLPALAAALRDGNRAVLEAPPGAGKTTRVPLALLDEPWLGGQKLVMLEPRRLAARAAARRMAQTLGERAGGTVGYRVRLDSRVSARTRIEVVTEGVLTRMLQDDPALDGVGCVVFDEFHERNLPSDLGLALALESQTALRPGLRLVVMSATLDGERVAALLAEGGQPAPLVRSEGRAFPVETHYLDRTPQGRTEDLAARAVRRAMAETDGDALVFLPGAGEIRRTEERLREGLPTDVDLAPLFGALPAAEQDRAIAPSPTGRRKVVLATDIAETSLTIEGVRVVVDAGLARRPRFDPASGMTRLETVRVSRASADQRRGRAGRLGPGTCHRLWTEFEHSHLAPFTPPEIAAADLAPLALELAAWGADPAALRWLDPPPEASFQQARALLRDLRALDGQGRVTPHGRRMARLGAHPRLAHLVLRGDEMGLGATACRLAALLGERDPLRSPGRTPPPADLRLRLDLLRGRSAPPSVHGCSVDQGAVARAREDAKRWQRRLGIGLEEADAEAAGLLLALAYPERVAQRRPGSSARYRLRNGRAAALPDADALTGADFLTAAHLGGHGREARIFLAAPVTAEELEEQFADEVDEAEEVVWEAEAGRVVARRQVRLGGVVLREGPLPEPDPTAVAEALLGGIRAAGAEALPWSKAARRLRDRLGFLHALDPGAWPDVSDDALLASADDWLLPHLWGMTRLDDLRRLDLAEALLAWLPWERREEIDRLAPSHLAVPSGSRIPVDYAEPEAPVLAVRLQEVFGLTETPRVGGGRVPVVMHLLSPAHRPAQVTRDLASFWREGYFDVRKDLRGRYPKHHWPEDPLTAEATHRAKRRR